MSKTEGEHKFEEFCARWSIHCKPIEQQDGKRPDYDLLVDERRIYVEVKDIEATPKDIHWPAMDKRVRRETDGAKPQLKNRIQVVGPNPTMLVLYMKNELVWPDRTDIKCALYGDEVAVFQDKTEDPFDDELLGVKLGGGRRASRDFGNWLSAVATLSHGPQTTFNVYHNHFASHPIDVSWLPAECATHFQFNPDGEHPLAD